MREFHKWIASDMIGECKCDECAREEVCEIIKTILVTSPMSLEQLKEVCNRVKREVYE